jgi:hypothetical protein
LNIYGAVVQQRAARATLAAHVIRISIAGIVEVLCNIAVSLMHAFLQCTSLHMLVSEIAANHAQDRSLLRSFAWHNTVYIVISTLVCCSPRDHKRWPYEFLSINSRLYTLVCSVFQFEVPLEYSR